MPQFIESIIENLTASERNVIESYFSIKAKSNDLLTRRYILQLLNKRNRNNSIKVNRTLTSRAFDELTEVLTSNYNITNGYFNSHDKILLGLKKKILLARIISKNLNQNKMKPFKTFLNILITEAAKNEIYEIVIEALYLKKYFFALKEGAKEFQRMNKRIEYFELCQKRTYHASDCYFTIVSNTDLLKQKNNHSLHNFILKSIRTLKSDYKKYKSSQINYYLHIILMYYYERRKKYNLAARYAKIMFSLVENSPVLYREERLGFAMINLSQYKTFTGNFTLASKFVKIAQSFYIENSNNYLISKNLEFLIYFYQRKYDKAHNCLKELLDQNLSDSGVFTRSKYIYYNAVLNFERNSFNNALKLLRRSLEIEKDKTRWNISLRILYIMIFIELNKGDEAISALESLKKYVNRIDKKDEISKRDKLIVKLLQELEKSGFQYHSTNFIVQKMIEKLTEKNTDISWQYFSSELIPFHEWISKKSAKA